MASDTVDKMLPWNGIESSVWKVRVDFGVRGNCPFIVGGGLPRSQSIVLRTSGDRVAPHDSFRSQIISQESKYCTPPEAPPAQRYTWLRGCRLHPWTRMPRVLAGAVFQATVPVSKLYGSTHYTSTVALSPPRAKCLRSPSHRARTYPFHYALYMTIFR